MTYSDIIATVSCILAFLALIGIYQAGKESNRLKRRQLTELITKTKWHNEGDIDGSPKAYYTLEIYKSGGISDVYGSLKVNIDEFCYEFNGKFNNKGTLHTNLRIPIGKRGANIAQIKLMYSEEKDEIRYVFKNYIDNLDWASEHKLLDCDTALWREDVPFLPPKDTTPQ